MTYNQKDTTTVMRTSVNQVIKEKSYSIEYNICVGYEKNPFMIS